MYACSSLVQEAVKMFSSLESAAELANHANQMIAWWTAAGVDVPYSPSYAILTYRLPLSPYVFVARIAARICLLILG